MIRHFLDDAGRPTRGLRLVWAFTALAAALGGTYLMLREAPGRLEARGTGVPFEHLVSPQPAAALHFENAADKRLSLADFRGKILLLNVWATWCLPCRREMPALDRLQQALGGPQFQVIAVSIDQGGIPTVKRYFAALGVHSLDVYVDPTMQVANALGITGTPTTFLIDRSGRERGVHLGPAKWDAPRTERFLRALIAASARGSGP